MGVQKFAGISPSLDGESIVARVVLRRDQVLRRTPMTWARSTMTCTRSSILPS